MAFTLLADSFVYWHNKWLTLPLVAGHTGAARKPKCLLSFIERYGMYETLYFLFSLLQQPSGRSVMRSSQRTKACRYNIYGKQSQQWWSAALSAEIGFLSQLMGTREAELIRECRPPVHYLNGD